MASNNFFSQPPPPPAAGGTTSGFYNPSANPYAAPAPAASSTDWYTPTPPPAPAVSSEASTSQPYGQPMQSSSTSATSGTTTSSSIPAAPASLGAVEKAQLSGALSQMPSGPMNNGASSTTAAPRSGGAIGPIGQSGSSNSMKMPGYDPDEFADEPPLLEELGINIPHIIAKSKVVLLPIGRVTKSIDPSLMDDDDLAGPLAFALLLGGELLLTAKLHFGYIYGFGLSGWMAMTLIVNLMSPKNEATSAWSVMSILGYCLLPVNVLAALNVLYRLKHGGVVGMILAGLTILWCTVASTRLFERSCEMRSQRYLIAYPSALLYSCFVMITIF